LKNLGTWRARWNCARWRRTAEALKRAGQCGCKKIKLNVSASPMHNMKNLNCTPKQSVARFADCESAAKDAGISLSGSISMPFGSPWEERISIEDVLDLVEAYRTIGVDEVSFSDTSGVAVPTQVSELCNRVRNAFPNVLIWLHFHNTRGLAMANILAAMEEGCHISIRRLPGLGGCPFAPGAAGNVASEDVVHMLAKNAGGNERRLERMHQNRADGRGILWPQRKLSARRDRARRNVRTKAMRRAHAEVSI
jgi:isopropylmalate/homocitrate/citramalate synthase